MHLFSGQNEIIRQKLKKEGYIYDQNIKINILK